VVNDTILLSDLRTQQGAKPSGYGRQTYESPLFCTNLAPNKWGGLLYLCAFVP
jgi:hypothetical protein